MKIQQKRARRLRRSVRTRARIYGTPERLRLSVFRSSKHMSVQFIDDTNGTTILGVSDMSKGAKPAANVDAAAVFGTLVGQLAVKNGIQSAVFDRGSYAYHGRVKALADAVRQAGVVF